ncbi:hypothetical protein PIB30_113416, partial [Stylosanthes scabra]|nr:hypothetical protein [Stylosanthes scabra]
KNKMKIWIHAQDMKVWKVVEQGDHIPMKKSTTKVGETSKVIEIPKDESEFDDDDLKKISLNKAINFIHCALNEDLHMRNRKGNMG